MALGLRSGLFFGLGVLATLGGCTAVLGIKSDRYLVEAGPEEAGGPVDAGPDIVIGNGPWDCLQLPDEQLDPSATVDVEIQVFDAVQPSTAAGMVDGGSDLNTVTGAWQSGATVRYCEIRDPNCTMASAPAVTDDAGIVHFPLKGDFSGFFTLKRSDLVPATLYAGNLLAGHPNETFPWASISPSGFQSLTAIVTSSPPSLDTDGGLGHAFITVYDCQDHQAAGVSYTYSNNSDKTVVFYMKSGLPTTQENKTDNFGLGGAINEPVGALTVHATLASNLMPIGALNILIRPGAITYANVRIRSH
jgi:hypothetical protein